MSNAEKIVAAIDAYKAMREVEDFVASARFWARKADFRLIRIGDDVRLIEESPTGAREHCAWLMRGGLL